MKGLKQFILRGNVVELAVGVVIGASFNDVVSSFVASFITPIISLLTPSSGYQQLFFEFRGARFTYGDFISNTLSFLIIALSVYFLIVLPMNKLSTYAKTQKSPDPTSRKCPYCFSEVLKQATRCPHCTSEIAKE